MDLEAIWDERCLSLKEGTGQRELSRSVLEGELHFVYSGTHHGQRLVVTCVLKAIGSFNIKIYHTFLISFSFRC